jgi:hypothetical protein
MIGLMLGVVSLAAWGTTACEQPTIDCRVTRGSFSTRFEKTSSTGSCQDITWGVIGLQSYYAANAERTSPDVTSSNLAIRPELVGELALEAEHYVQLEEASKGMYCAGAGAAYMTREATAVGDFVSVDPDANGVCQVANMKNPARVVLQDIPASGDPMDEDNECGEGVPGFESPTWAFRNVKVFVTTAAPGNRFEADLTYTAPDPMGGTCTQEYKICGLWPLVDCAELAKVEDPKDCSYEDPLPEGAVKCKCPEDEPGTCILPTGKGNDKLCDPDPDIELYGRPTGSSITEEFGAVCDPTSLYCVLPKCPIPVE